MIDHVTIKVKDLAKAKAFYSKALAPLGYKVMAEYPNALGMGADKPDFWIGKYETTAPPAHVAFAAKDTAMVDAFHAAALAAGGKDEGKPGPRDYHAGYYGAFVLDPEGNNIEAVIHHHKR